MATANSLHTLNTLPAAEVRALVDTRSRRYVARLDPAPIPLSRRFCFADMTDRVDCGVDTRWASPRFRAVAALRDTARWCRDWRQRRRARQQVCAAVAEPLQLPGLGVTRALLVTVAVEIALGLLVVAGVALRGRHA